MSKKEEETIKQLRDSVDFYRKRSEEWSQQYARTMKELVKIRFEKSKLLAALERVEKVGHNDECLFCGLKDKEVKAALLGEEAK